MKKGIKIPSHLSKQSSEFYSVIMNEFELEPHHCELLTLACECLDRMRTARNQIKKDGLFCRDRYGQTKTHPAQRVENDNKTLFARLIRELGLDITDPSETRLPRLRG